ncbi:diacylglycerol/lipid kinase family protein [Tessaracoccus antarcticus]|uniref:diacylglycerol/lipid kinase family protein n=1 Tax=Tessaracoccus antarcticus TaxID=2479848 RepID=UPI001F39A8E6|nr:diacylglycerol kinase family protein [Tessaracoccus antarcticus]
MWFATSPEDPGQEAARSAIDNGADLIITAGGDGTVRAVAEAVRGTGTRMALLPSGTGNLLARNLKLTLNDITHSVEVAFSGVDREIDLGVIDIERPDGTTSTHVFVVMAGMGLDAKMIENTDDDLKAKAGWIAYVKAIVLSLRDPNKLHVRLQLDGGTEKRATVHTLILGNCGSLPGNILLLPDAKVDDGLFDLMLMRPSGLMGWISVWFKVAWINRILRGSAADASIGKLSSDRSLRYETGTRLAAHLSRPEKIELDGDGFGEATAFNAWMEPGALTVRVPAH